MAEATYSISPSRSYVNEGDSLTTSISTTNVAENTTLYYSLSGSGITSDDLSSGSLTGSGTVDSNGNFSFSHTFANDLSTEGNETVDIKLFSDSSHSTQVGTTASVAILDTSKAATYTISPSATSLNEGETLTTSISTNGVAEGTTLYWSISGNGITSNDFSSGSLTGSGTVDSDGNFSFSHTLANDLTTEGQETPIISLYTTSDRTDSVANTSSMLAIADTSKAATYDLGILSAAHPGEPWEEGLEVWLELTTTNVPENTTFYWSVTGNGITDDDFSRGSVSGSGTTNNQGKIFLDHQWAKDQIQETDETPIFSFFTDSERSNQVLSKTIYTISDPKVSTYSINPSASSINEGQTLTTSISTTNVAENTTLYYSLSGTGITSDDFSSGSLTGSGTVDSDGDGDPTNDMDGDGIWDTTAIIVGMRSDVPEQWGEFDQLLEHFDDIIDNRPMNYQSTNMTVTGLTKTLEDVSDAIYDDLIKMMPYSILFTILIISFLHRSAKVVIITGTPILLALGVTFGASVVLKWTLTPMIVATFPILIGLGVDYALHMVNRIEEVRRKEIERVLEENNTPFNL